jgi:hypothetical protein
MQEPRKVKIPYTNHCCDTVPLFLRAMEHPYTRERIEIPPAALPCLLHLHTAITLSTPVLSSTYVVVRRNNKDGPKNENKRHPCTVDKPQGADPLHPSFKTVTAGRNNLNNKLPPSSPLG